MNIIVKPYGSDRCYCRPDTTWERENRDFYSPECVNMIFRTPVLFARITKPGKCIGEKFVSRYYDAVGYGMLIYCSMDDYARDSLIAFGSCADHTSILPQPLYNPAVLENPDNIFEIKEDGKTSYLCSCGAVMTSVLHDAICRASKMTSLRIGDMVAVELDEMLPVKGEHIRAEYCGNEIINIRIIR